MFLGKSKVEFGAKYFFGNYGDVDLCKVLDLSDVLCMFLEFTSDIVINGNLIQCNITSNMIIIEGYAPLDKNEIDDIDKGIINFLKNKIGDKNEIKNNN